jgi:branched-chain amino acid transport system permease protein
MEQLRKERIDRGIKVRTEGIYAISSIREISYLIFPRLFFIIGLLALPILMPTLYWKRVISITCVYALLALGYDLLSGFVGLVCLGEALFIGIGGYFSAILDVYFGLSLSLSIIIATIAGAIFCTLILLPCLPLRGVYFSIITLMYPLTFSRIIEATGILGGTDGITDLKGIPHIWIELYMLCIILIISLFLLRRIVNEDIGIVFRGIKDNDQAVKASGINITEYKVFALFISSILGTFAGAFLVHIYMWAGISLFAIDFSILPIAAAVIGGGGTFSGPVLGSFILIPISEILREFGAFRIVFYSLILTGFIIVKSAKFKLLMPRKYGALKSSVKFKFNYLTSTVAPAASNSVLAASASSFEIPSLTTAPASSAIAFASFNPKPVNALTALITLIFLSPALLIITSNSVFSSPASAPPAAAPPATATG